MFAVSKTLPTFATAIEKQWLQIGAIAQLVEQRTENPCVPGSIPGGTTLKKLIIKQLSKSDSCFFLYNSFVFPMI